MDKDSTKETEKNNLKQTEKRKRKKQAETNLGPLAISKEHVDSMITELHREMEKITRSLVATGVNVRYGFSKKAFLADDVLNTMAARFLNKWANVPATRDEFLKYFHEAVQREQASIVREHYLHLRLLQRHGFLKVSHDNEV